MTDPDRMEAILDLLTEDEIEHALHGVDVFERAKHMDAEEAAEWGRRIVARQRFLEMGEQPGLTN